jgi:hypothetical protein
MATPALSFLPRHASSRTRRLIAGLSLLGLPGPGLHATGGYDDSPPPTLPYYLDRLPAKPPALIFEETFGGLTQAAKPTDFRLAVLALAASCEADAPPSSLLAATDELLVQARLQPADAAALCNLLEDVRDLFAATPPVTGKTAARYIRWRVEHAGWFKVFWDTPKPTPSPYGPSGNDADKSRREAEAPALDKIAADPAEKPLRAHWLYLRGACVYPGGGAQFFQQVVDEYPDDPRAEFACFMLARCQLAASRSHAGPYGEPPPSSDNALITRERAQARALFEDYLKRYPKGRFTADVPGWFGALAFDAGDYLGAIDQYIRQADVPGHPEVLKSAGFMCERCLSRLASADNTAALDKVSLHPRLAMSLIYLLVNSPEANNYDGKLDSPAQVARWRAALLPRLAAVVAAHRDAYAGQAWQGRYLAILAQAASGEGDQARALSLCDLDKGELARSDDLAFIRLVALGRAHRLPEAIAAAGEFARAFPRSPLARGAALRRVLALVDDQQAGTALVELYRLRELVAAPDKDPADDDSMNGPDASDEPNTVYPSADADLDASRSVLNSNITGAQETGLAQITDALLNFAPLPELATALLDQGDDQALAGADAATLRAVLAERWLAEEENFAEAKKYATPAQWSLGADKLEKLSAEAASVPAGEARATAFLRLADAWAAARGKLVFAPLETDETRSDIFTRQTGAQYADVRRRENGLALGLPADKINHALSSRDEWQHAFAWWLRAAAAAPPASATRARALWSALRAMPSMAIVSPYTFLRAGETDASQESRRLYERLCRECPDSHEAQELAVYYDLAPPHQKPNDNYAGVTADGSTDFRSADNNAAGPDLSAATENAALAYGEPEYHRDQSAGSGNDDPAQAKEFREVLLGALGLNNSALVANPASMGKEVERLRSRLNELRRGDDEFFLVNFLDDLSEFLQEPAAKLTPAVIRRYLQLRTECMSVEHWGTYDQDSDLPPVPGAGKNTLNQTVLGHIREAYRAPEMAAFKDYLDFLAMAVVANMKIDLLVPGEVDAKEGGDPGETEPVTYTSRDYPKLAKLAAGFLQDYPHSRKREAARLLYARALYDASRPRPLTKFAIWPQSPHYESGTIFFTHREEPIEPQKIGAALHAYDREFPHGRYAEDIRNLRGLLAWRTQDWPLAVDLTLQTLANTKDAVLQEEAGRRLSEIFCDGLTDDTARRHCLAAIKASPEAVASLRKYLPVSPFPLRALQSWLLAQL